MRSEQRLRRSSQFAAVFSEGKSRATETVVLKAVPNGLDFSRFGFIVSKKVSRKAVVRNKVRRRLREVVRLAMVRPGWDVVVIARPKAGGASYSDIESALIGLLNRVGLLGE